MEIWCDKNEFARLVRSCAFVTGEDRCGGCVFAPVCAQGGDLMDGDVMYKVEDICRIAAEG